MKDTDLCVGAVVPIHNRSFELLDADEFTYQYMENNLQTYPVADPQAALQTLGDAIHSGGNPLNSNLGQVNQFAMHASPRKVHGWCLIKKWQRKRNRAGAQEDALVVQQRDCVPVSR